MGSTTAFLTTCLAFSALMCLYYRPRFRAWRRQPRVMQVVLAIVAVQTLSLAVALVAFWLR